MKRSSILLIGAQFISTGAKLALFILLTQTGGFEVSGSYTYVLSVTTPTFILFGFSLRQIYVTSPSQVQYGHFLIMRGAYGLLGVLTVLIIALFLRPHMLGLFAAMAAYRFMESLVDIRIAYFQRASRVDLMALSTLLLAAVTTGSTAVAFMLTQNLVYSVLISFMLGIGLFLLLSNIAPDGQPNELTTLPPRRLLQEASKNGLLLSISAFSVSLGTSVPVLILGATHNNAAVGAYSSIYHISSISNILFTAVTQAELRVFAVLAAEARYTTFVKRGRKFSVSLSLVGILGTIILYCIGTELFSLIFGQDFSQYRAALLMMGFTICLAPFGFFLDVQLTSLQKFRIQTIISICTLAFSVLVGLVIVPVYSVFGATLVVFLTMALRNITKSVAVSRAIPKQK